MTIIYENNIEKIEKKEKKTNEKIEDEYNETRVLLNKESDSFTEPYILKMINEKEALRKIFLAVVKYNPAKVSDIAEYTLFYKQNCYPLLNQLTSLGLVKRIFVMDIYNGVLRDDEIMKKFAEWSRTMPENTKRYYMGKTSFWRITDLGKKFVRNAYEFDQKFRGGKNE